MSAEKKPLQPVYYRKETKVHIGKSEAQSDLVEK